MSFASDSDVMDQIERSLRHVWIEKLGTDPGKNFPRMTYHEAMSKYGSDKPDLRLGTQVRILRLSPISLANRY